MSIPDEQPVQHTRAEWLDRHQTLGPYESVGYIGLGEQYNRRLYALRRRHFDRLLLRACLRPDARVLDIGIGNGFYIERYRRLGLRDVRGVDISPDAVARAAQRFDDYQFAVCDVSAGLPTDIKTAVGFDVVSAMDVLFHIVEDDRFRAALRTCGQAVRPGGRLILSDNFPARTLPADTSQAYRALSDYEEVLRPLGMVRTELSPVFFISNGQVAAGGLGYTVVSTAWLGFTRALGIAIRRCRPIGEALGAAAGAVLTTADAVLQTQSTVRGYSTKVAVFRRDEGT
jgi:2-polyprenyl-3-methyl-5-hydroxy-6-metoxy-1,4-benzoquinol methylase